MLHWMKVWLHVVVNEKQIERYIAYFFKFIVLPGRKGSNKVVCRVLLSALSLQLVL